jgi:hypothetical protein
MSSRYKPHIPRDTGELVDHLAMMIFASPTFRDKVGDFPERNIETVFHALNEGLGKVRAQLGEERYQTLLELSLRMRAHFEADPEDKTGDSLAGRELILEMEGILLGKTK